MRVFVTGTGRCGTVTFSNACRLGVTNYTCRHEWHKGRVGDIEYPDNHIEVDPHLIWVMPLLIQKYPDALWVHLTRQRTQCIQSLEKRRSLVQWCRFACQASPDLKKAAQIHYDNTNALIPMLSPGCFTFRLERAAEAWPKFYEAIQAAGDMAAGGKAFEKRHNARVKS